MDPRMYPLATYVREIRQDWPLHAIQTTLSTCTALPYDLVAIGAVKAAVDQTVRSPQGIRKAAEDESRRRSPAGPSRLCRDCGRPHDPARPLEHVPPPDPERVREGAAAAREALRAGRNSPPAEPEPAGYEQPALEPDHMQRAAGDR